MPRSLLAMVLLSFIGSAALAAETKLPPGEKDAKARVDSSPRHGEYVDVTVPGRATPLRAYVVYPEVKEKAPVVIVIHEIFGLSDWIKSVADQLAADGFIAVAPDFLSGKGKDGKGTDGFATRDDVVKAVRELKADDMVTALNGVRDYSLKIPSASGKIATVGYCWGGGQSFSYAVAQPELNAAVVYYGTNPDAAKAATLKVPVLGNYGGNDNRVNATIPPAQDAIKKAGKTYEVNIYEGAGHGFLRQQDGMEGKNLKAAEQAWPATIKFLREQTK